MDPVELLKGFTRVFSSRLFFQLESTILSMLGSKISLVLGHFGIWIKKIESDF